MVDATRALLDELMGKDRDKVPSERKHNEVHFSDPEICKFYLCGFCPHDLFINTKSDLGPCPKIHDDYCKQQFQDLKNKDAYPYERDFFRFLQRLIDDLDRKIRRGHERLTNQEESSGSSMSSEKMERINTITTKLQELLIQIERLGEEGKIDESQQLMKMVEHLKEEKEQLQSGSNIQILSPQEKRMKVCEVCGAYLVVGDTEKRIQSHVEGKQHVGFALIRKTLPELRERFRDDERRSRSGKYRDSRYADRKDRDYKKRERDDYYYDSRDKEKKKYRD